jgi:hypothetical protein
MVGTIEKLTELLYNPTHDFTQLKIRKEKGEKILTMVVWLIVLLISYSLAAWMISLLYRALKSLVAG